jgi:hypothetical protein
MPHNLDETTLALVNSQSVPAGLFPERCQPRRSRAAAGTAVERQQWDLLMRSLRGRVALVKLRTAVLP